MPLLPGTKLGNYEIVNSLGAGGMGEVYRARDVLLKRQVAVKVLPAIYSTDDDRLQRFQQEAEATAALNHPNILSIFAVGQHEGTSYIVTELLEGETLRAKVNASLQVRKALDYALQITSGLAAAHEKGIIHRDLKPDNIFVTKDDRLKILDFGLAKLLESEPVGEALTCTRDNITREGQVLGTAGYMAPEQIRGQAADARSDIFAFGTVIFEILTGKAAFKRESMADTQSAALKEDPPQFETLNVKAPPALERIVRRCLEKSPERRFQNALDLRFALETFSGVTTDPASTISIPNPKRPIIASWWPIVASAVFITAAALIFRWTFPSQVLVENVRQLTNSGQSKLTITGSSLVSDGSRLYFTEGSGDKWHIAQASTSGGQVASVATSVTDPQVTDIAPDSSALLVISGEEALAPLWFVPLPVGSPHAVMDGKRKEHMELLATVPLLIIDDLGMRKLAPTAGEELLEIVMRRHERASTLLTSNRPVEDWGKLLGDSAAVTAMLDRLLHHGHILKCGPRSWRTKTGLPDLEKTG